MKFVATHPTPQQVVAEAGRLGGMEIDMLDQTAREATVAFRDFPNAKVSISAPAKDRLFIVDLTLVAPALLQLLVKAGVSLGGQSNAPVADHSLQLPLTNRAIRKASRRTHWSSAIGTFGLVLLLSAAGCLVVGVLLLLAYHA